MALTESWVDSKALYSNARRTYRIPKMIDHTPQRRFACPDRWQSGWSAPRWRQLFRKWMRKIIADGTVSRLRTTRDTTFRDPTAVTAREFVEVVNANDPRAEAVLHDDGSVSIHGVAKMPGVSSRIVPGARPPPESQCCACRYWRGRLVDENGDAPCSRRRRCSRRLRNAYDAACGWYKP